MNFTSRAFTFAAATAMITVLSVAPGVAQAQTLSLRYVDISYLELDIDNDDGIALDGSGYSAELVFGGQTWFFYAEFADGDLDGDFAGTDLDADFKSQAAGLGGQVRGEKTAGYFRIGLADFEVDAGSIENEESGYGVELGLRHQVGDNSEVNARVEFMSIDPSGIDNSSIGVGVGVVLGITDHVGLLLDYADVGDLQTLKAGVRVSFGGAARGDS